MEPILRKYPELTKYSESFDSKCKYPPVVSKNAESAQFFTEIDQQLRKVDETQSKQKQLIQSKQTEYCHRNLGRIVNKNEAQARQRLVDTSLEHQKSVTTMKINYMTLRYDQRQVISQGIVDDFNLRLNEHAFKRNVLYKKTEIQDNSDYEIRKLCRVFAPIKQQEFDGIDDVMPEE